MILENQPNSGGIAAVLDALRHKNGWKLNVQLGEGGFAYVYKESVGGLPRAVKITKSPVSTNTGPIAAEQGARLSELKLLRDLGGHPRLLTLIQYELLLGHLVTVWELAESSLADEMRKRDSKRQTVWQQSDLDQLLQWLKEAAEGIDYLNQNGVYHRDIKPQNLFLMRGHVKVGDFGLAKEATASVLSNTGVGTIGYMPPEAMAGQTHAGIVHQTIDLYGLAATYVRLRTGREPFGTTLVEIFQRMNLGAFERLGMSKAEVECVAQALRPEPQARFNKGVVAWVDQLAKSIQTAKLQPPPLPPGVPGRNAVSFNTSVNVPPPVIKPHTSRSPELTTETQSPQARNGRRDYDIAEWLSQLADCSLRAARKGAKLGCIFGPIVGVICGPIIGAIAGPAVWGDSEGFPIALLGGLIGGLFWGCIGGLLGGPILGWIAGAVAAAISRAKKA